MSTPTESIKLNKSEYNSLISKLATLEVELRHARKLLEVPAKTRRTFWQSLLERSAMVLIVLVMVGVSGAGIWGVEGFYSGNQYLNQKNLFRGGYLAGVSDTFSLVAETNKVLLAVKYIKCIRPMTFGQIQVIVEKYLNDHPEQRDNLMADLVWTAVTESCAQ